MEIRKLFDNEEAPFDLLLVADPSRKLVKNYLNRGECYVLEHHNEIIGAYVLLPTKTATIELVNVVVTEKEQGKGIGKKLIMDAIQKSKDRGYKTLELGTGNSSIGQLALYQKCGFRIVDVDLNFFTRNYVEKIFENGIWCRDMIRLSLALDEHEKNERNKWVQQ